MAWKKLSLVYEAGYEDIFGSIYTLSGNGCSYVGLKDSAGEIHDRPLKISGVAKVGIYAPAGGRLH